jgi:hypothetical protein
MALYVLNDGMVGFVQADLRKIYPWSDLTFAAIPGATPLLRVVVTSPPAPSLIASVIAALVSSPADVAVVGGLSTRPVKIGANPAEPLSAMGGVTYPDRYPSTSQVNILYDCEAGAGCSGRGRFASGTAPGSTVDAPTDVVLLHELVHAYHFLTNGFSGDPRVTAEVDVLPLENTYRVSRSPPLGERGGHGGGCNSGPPSSTSPSTGSSKSKSKPGNCFIATAVLQTDYQARLNELRNFRDEVVYAHAGGAAFMDRFYACYGHVGPLVAGEIALSPGRRRKVLALAVIPVVSYLTLAVRAPAALPPEHQIPDDWQAFFAELMIGLECWAVAAVEPKLPCEGDEAAFVERYVLRTEVARAAYQASQAAGQATPTFKALVERSRLGLRHFLAQQPLDRVVPGRDFTAGWVVAAAQAFGPRAMEELASVRQAFEAAGAGDVFQIAFETPLWHFMRLCCAMPSGVLPWSLPEGWRSVIAAFRQDVNAVFEALLDLPDPDPDPGSATGSGER